MSAPVPPPTVGASRETPLRPPRPLFFTERGQDDHDPIDPFQTPTGSTHNFGSRSGPGTPDSHSEYNFDGPHSPSGPSSFATNGSIGIIPGRDLHGHVFPSADIAHRSSGIVSVVDLTSHHRDKSVTSGVSGFGHPFMNRVGSTISANGIEETERPHMGARRPTSHSVREAFSAPPVRPLTLYTGHNGSTATADASENGKVAPNVPVPTKRLRSTMLVGEIEKPWTTEKDTLKRLAYWITYGVMLLGVAASFVRCYFGYIQIPRFKRPLCLVLDDNFDTLDTQNVWSHEVDMSGFGNGEFEMATDSSNNSFVEDGLLYLMPTLTSDVIGSAAVFDGHTFNLTGCTNTNTSSCGAVSNATAGTVINPAMSARLSTKGARSIRFGRVEVRAKNPRGDWLWPAIWMLPVDDAYGAWPASGEIDIMESRGNKASYKAQGTNFVRGTLNWGPVSWLNAAWRTYGFWTERRKNYSDDFHTYVLEWTEDFLRIYVDTRLHHLVSLKFDEPFWKRGKFPTVVTNGTQQIVLQDPWITNATVPNAAPFDQEFYLILDLAVGGTNGWFPDNIGDKPWLDGSNNAMRDFAKAQDKWYATWPQGDNIKDRALVVDYVKMWAEC